MRYRPQSFLPNPRVQPQCVVAANLKRFPDLRHVLWPRTLSDVVTGRLLSNTGTVPAKTAVGPGGLCFDTTGATTQAFSLRTTVPPAVGWTLEAIVSFSTIGGTRFVSHDGASAPSGTYDRCLEFNGTKVRAYIWDGGAKSSENSATLNVNTVYHIIGTCSASQLICYVDGVASTPTTVANSGFNYGPNVWLIAGHNSNALVSLVAMWGRPLTAAEVMQRTIAPYSILLPAG